MELYTDYPLKEDGDTQKIVKVTLLSYDRNKYCEVKAEDGEVYSVKSGYLFQDQALTQRLTSRQIFSVPAEVGDPKPTKLQIENELREKRKHLVTYSLRILVGQSAKVIRFKNLQQALHHVAIAIKQGYEVDLLRSTQKRYFYCGEPIFEFGISPEDGKKVYWTPVNRKHRAALKTASLIKHKII